MTEAAVTRDTFFDLRVPQNGSDTSVAREIQRRSREAVLQDEINRLVARPDSTRQTLQRCTDAIVNNLRVMLARIWTLKQGKKVLELQASSGLYTGLHGRYSRIPVGHCSLGRIAETRTPHLTNEALTDTLLDHDWVVKENVVGFAGYPLIVDDRVVGLIAIFARFPMTPATLDTIASIAGIVAQGIDRKRWQNELLRSKKVSRDAVLAERTRIAREMHDGLLQNVTGIALHLRAVLPRVRSSPEEAATILERILALAERTSTEARLAVVDMRHITETGDIVKALRSTVERALEDSAVDLSVNVRGRTRAVSARVCDGATWIVQHAITNILRHAHAHRVQVTVEFGIRKLGIRVHDDGRGFASAQGLAVAGHFGLMGMRERAREIGGQLRVRSAPGRGTTVTVLVAYSAQ